MIDSIIGFFSKQWATLLSVGAGLLILARIIKYIEDSATNREELRQIRDHENIVFKNREKIKIHNEEIRTINRMQLDNRMHDNNELHNPTK